MQIFFMTYLIGTIHKFFNPGSSIKANIFVTFSFLKPMQKREERLKNFQDLVLHVNYVFFQFCIKNIYFKITHSFGHNHINNLITKLLCLGDDKMQRNFNQPMSMAFIQHITNHNWW